MNTLFFYGSLRDHDLLELVLDRVVEPEDLVPAWVADHAAMRLENEAYPFLSEAHGERAEGILITNLSDADMARVQFFEDVEYVRAPLQIETTAGAVATQFFEGTERLKATNLRWDFADWQHSEKAVAMEAATEFMSFYGILPSEEADALWHGIMIRARMRALAKAETPVTGTLRPVRTKHDVIAQPITRPYARYFAIEEHTLSHRRFDGTMSAEIQRTVLTSGDAVTVVPYDPVRDQVLLIEQFRAGMHARGDACPWGD